MKTVNRNKLFIIICFVLFIIECINISFEVFSSGSLFSFKKYKKKKKYINTSLKSNDKSLQDKELKIFIINKYLGKNKEEIVSHLRQSFLNKVDIVFSWVNGSDTSWERNKKKYIPSYLEDLTGKSFTKNDKSSSMDSLNNNRFKNHNELLYSIRSIYKYVSWIRNIYIVVADGQIPSYFNFSHSNIHLINHSSIFLNHTELLPNFNSAVIENQLIHIPNISDYFLYLNDDFFFMSNSDINDFFISSFNYRGQVFYTDNYGAPKYCSVHCSIEMLGNGKCDEVCNNEFCGWDHYECNSSFELNMKEFRNKKKKVYSRNSGSFMHSISFTNQVFNRLFGKSTILNEPIRSAISHIPILINKKLVQDMINYVFPIEYKNMISHRFRHPEDIQFQFSYVYYVLENQMYAPSISQIWEKAIESYVELYILIKKENPLMILENVYNNYKKNTVIFLYGDVRTLKPHEIIRKNKIVTSMEYHILELCIKQLFMYNETNILDIFNQTFYSEFLLLNNNKTENKWFHVCQKAVYNLVHVYDIRLPNGKYKHEVKKRTRNINYFLGIRDNKKSNDITLKRMKNIKTKYLCLEDDMHIVDDEVENKLHETFEFLFPNKSVYEL